MYKSLIKRIIDIIVSSLLLLGFSPVIIIICIVLIIANRGKPFFLQQRPGKNEHLFWLLKFKTMNDKKDENGDLLADHLRITKIGGFVRKNSLDELLQLFNVLIGNMSLVGPRPLLIEYLSLYNEEQLRRHEIKPGITGWAQVNGRNAISWKQRFEYDIWYIENVSFVLDFKILFLTLKKVINKEGISKSVFLTMEKFEGN